MAKMVFRNSLGFLSEQSAGVKIRAYAGGDLDQVVNLWRSAGLVTSKNHPEQDIERKLKVDAELFLVTVQDNKVVATAMGGYEGHRGWVNYLAVDQGFRNKGVARSLMNHLEGLLVARGCAKINLQVRTSNKDAIDFYLGQGFEHDDVVSLGKRLIRD